MMAPSTSILALRIEKGLMRTYFGQYHERRHGKIDAPRHLQEPFALALCSWVLDCAHAGIVRSYVGKLGHGPQKEYGHCDVEQEMKVQGVGIDLDKELFSDDCTYETIRVGSWCVSCACYSCKERDRRTLA